MSINRRVSRRVRGGFALVCLVVFVSVFTAMRLYVWQALETAAVASLDPAVREQLDLIATTPFDVVLFQVEIAAIAAVLTAAVGALSGSRESRHGRRVVEIVRERSAAFVALSGGLALGGGWIAYEVVFPLIVRVLVGQTSTGMRYGVTEFTGVLVLSVLAFAMAVPLPFWMWASSHAGIVSHETFRRWSPYVLLLLLGLAIVFVPSGSVLDLVWCLLPVMVMASYCLGLAIAECASDRPDDRERW